MDLVPSITFPLIHSTPATLTYFAAPQTSTKASIKSSHLMLSVITITEFDPVQIPEGLLSFKLSVARMCFVAYTTLHINKCIQAGIEGKKHGFTNCPLGKAM